MKRCPYCSEQIQDAAIKCRYCGERLTDAAGHPADTLDSAFTVPRHSGSSDAPNVYDTLEAARTIRSGHVANGTGKRWQ